MILVNETWNYALMLLDISQLEYLTITIILDLWLLFFSSFLSKVLLLQAP